MLRATIGALLLLAGSAASAQRLSQPFPVFGVDASSFSTSAEVWTPGAFSADEPSETITPLCLASGSSYLEPGPGGSVACPNTGGTGLPAAITTPAPAAGVALQIEQLGLTASQWATAQTEAADTVTSNSDVLKMIGKSVSLTSDGTQIYWTFNSGNLPTVSTYEIPGSGIFLHIQDQLAYSPFILPFARVGEYLQLAASFSLPSYTITNTSGNASTPPTAIVVLGLSFQTYNTAGVLEPISLLVGLFNSKGLYSEYVSTDGRNSYVSSYVSAASNYLTANSTQELITNTGNQNFWFSITSSNMSAIIAALNSYYSANSITPLSTDVTQVRLHQVDLRNENSFLDKGTNSLAWTVAYLRAFPVLPSDTVGSVMP